MTNLLSDATFAGILQKLCDLLLVGKSVKRLVTSVGWCGGLWTYVVVSIVKQQFQFLINSATQTDRQTHTHSYQLCSAASGIRPRYYIVSH